MKKPRSNCYTILKSITNKISTTNTIWLTSIPAIIAILIMAMLGNANLSKINSMIIVSCIFILSGFSSLVVVIRKEFPFYRIISGKVAIVIGIIGLFLSWSIALLIIIRIMLELLGK